MTTPILIATATAAAAVIVAAAPVRRRVADARRLVTPRRPVHPVHRRGRGRAQAPTSSEVAAWCDDLARLVRGGSSISSALATSPDHPALATLATTVAGDTARGHALAGALRRAHQRAPSADTSLVVGVLAACAELGGPAAAPLERAAVTLRTRAAIAAEHDVHSAQARLSARVLTVMPVGLLVLGVLADRGVRTALMSPLGIVVVIVGLLCNCLGWWWMRHVLSSSVGAS